MGFLVNAYAFLSCKIWENALLLILDSVHFLPGWVFVTKMNYPERVVIFTVFSHIPSTEGIPLRRGG